MIGARLKLGAMGGAHISKARDSGESMKKLLVLVCGLAVAFPLYADEMPPEDEPAEVAEPPAEEAAPIEEAAPVEEAPAEEVVAEEAPEEEVVEESEPLHFYVGANYVMSKFSVSESATFPVRDFDSSFVDLRAGIRVFEAIGIEAHFGIPTGSEDTGDEAKTDQYWGVFVVPTATLFETIELGFPVGYASSTMVQSGLEEDYGTVAYGVNIEVPLQLLGESLPNFRLVGGGMVYAQQRETRIYGYHAGARFDFDTNFNFSMPDLWPFGDDDEDEAAEEADAE